MSKFNILIEKSDRGEEWLDALTFTFYLFLSPEPSPETVAFLSESCQNQIAPSVTFCRKKLYNFQQAVEKEGYALSRPGPKEGSPEYFYAIDDYDRKTCTMSQGIRRFETVILVERSDPAFYVSPFRVKNTSYTRKTQYRFAYLLCKRSLSIRTAPVNHEKNRVYDYYCIPQGNENAINTYVPTQTEFLFTRDDTPVSQRSTSIIIPYSPQALETLKSLFSRLTTIEDCVSRFLFQPFSPAPDESCPVITGLKPLITSKECPREE
jgi:hypothetical protein